MIMLLQLQSYRLNDLNLTSNPRFTNFEISVKLVGGVYARAQCLEGAKFGVWRSSILRIEP